MTESLSQESAAIQYGSKVLKFEIIRAHRRTLAISVHPDLRIVARAPIEAELKTIKAKIKKRASWIIKQRVYFSDFLPRTPAKTYQAGETFWYLGRQYRLKIKQGLPSIQLKGKFLNISSLPDKNYIKESINTWYHSKSVKYFQKKLEEWWPRIAKNNASLPQLVIKKMSKRWGSFTKGKKIILNTELIQTPSQCIDYVIAHELCHVFHQNHSRAYFKLLKKIMPDWEKRKQRLEQFEI